MYNGTQDTKIQQITTQNILTESIIWKYVHVIYTEITPQDCYQERNRQVLFKSVLEVCLTDISVWPLYYKSHLGTPNWGHRKYGEYCYNGHMEYQVGLQHGTQNFQCTELRHIRA